MALPERQSPPAANRGASKMSGDDSTHSTRTDAAECFRNAYGVLVIGKAQRRYVYFGLPAAQRAVDRAHARGDYAELVLVRLVPVADELAPLIPMRGEAS